MSTWKTIDSAPEDKIILTIIKDKTDQETNRS